MEKTPARNNTSAQSGQTRPASGGSAVRHKHRSRAGKAILAGILALGANATYKEATDPWPWQTLHPDGNENQNSYFMQEAARVEASFGTRKIIPFQIEDMGKANFSHVDPEAAGPLAANPFSVLHPHFFVVPSGRVKTKMRRELGLDMPNLLDGNLEALISVPNQISLEAASLKMETSLKTGSMGAAMPAWGYQDGEHIHGCSVHGLPFYLDKNTSVRSLSVSGGLQKVVAVKAELGEVRRFTADHELIHCMTAFGFYEGLETEQKYPWFAESVADLYGVARHIQRDGLDDRFAHDVMAIRELEAFNGAQGDMGHYSVPILQRALPHLEEAYKNKELEGMDPKELFTFISGKVFNNPHEPDAAANIHEEFGYTQKGYIALKTIGETGRITFSIEEALHEHGFELQDLEVFSGRIKKSQARLFNDLDPEKDTTTQLRESYAQSLDEMIREQPSPQQAYVAITARMQILSEQAIQAAQDHQTPRDVFYDTVGTSGLSRRDEYDTLREKQEDLRTWIKDLPERAEPAPGKNTFEPEV